MEKVNRIHPFYWSALMLLISQAVSLAVASQVEVFVDVNQIEMPEVSLGVPLTYFLVSVAVLGIVLFIIPMSKLKIVFRVLFVLLFAWGLFVDLSFFMPVIAAVSIALVAAVIWLLKPVFWFHNLLLLLTLASIGAVFGYLFAPWTAVILLLLLSIYDILAVRFGYMMWMAKKLSQLDTLPAFVMPKSISGWNRDLRNIHLMDDEDGERDYSLLGGGDIGFPLILIIAVYFTYGFGSSLVLVGATIIGLVLVYFIQRVFLKGKPMAALPPMAFSGLVGYLIVFFVQG